ncbi:MAG: AAA family ATPase [Candidatus Methanomethylophilaceae archaeon]|nr:AAA family ATPase [Candidatus Methanomethylophilaceae archaeon]
MKLIVVAGMPGAGKEEFLNVAIDMGLPFIRMGDLVRELYPKRSEEDKDLTLGQFANIERERHGYNIWAKRALDRMSGSIYLIDGCRSMDEIKAFRGLSDDVNIVAIHAPPKVRYERLVKRHRDDAPKDVGEFEARDSREIGWGLAEVVALADHLILNDGPLERFRADASSYLRSVA